MKSGVEFISALVVAGDRLYIAGSPDAFEPFSPFTRLFAYYGDRKQPWTKHDVEWWTVALEMSRRVDGGRIHCALSQEGQVELISQGTVVVEKIADAGVWSPGNKGYGYLSGLRHIGDRLYACGGGGQVYKRLGPDNWVHMDAGLLQDRKALADGTIGRMLLRTIDGPAEDDIYVAGSMPGEAGYQGVLFHWQNTAWRQIDIPPLKQLNAIHIESADRLWLYGIDGALLVGNHREGFEDWSDTTQGQLFHDLTMYDDTLYLASNKGLCAYDGKRRRIVRVKTGLTPEPTYLATIDHADGILWCVGRKDIVRYDGKAWTRIYHPDNPRKRRIGE
jgi:hypothetical protein